MHSVKVEKGFGQVCCFQLVADIWTGYFSAHSFDSDQQLSITKVVDDWKQKLNVKRLIDHWQKSNQSKMSATSWDSL